MDSSYVNHLWRAARDAEQAGNLLCPLCHNAMRVVEHLVPKGEPSQAIHVDVCTTCHSVWFDTHEIDSLLEHVALPAQAPAEPELSPKAREILAMAKVESIRRQAESEDMLEGQPPADGWSTILTVFGFPAEEDVPEIARFPIVTWSVISIMFIATMLAGWGEAGIIQQWGLIPFDPLRHNGMTFVSSFFLHAGVLHLVGNAVFLALFGDNVEDYLGHLKFAFLLIGSSALADMLHMMFEPHGEIPMVGASGGISGVIAYYALRFPKARLVYFLRFGFFFRWIRFSARSGFFIWVAFQAFGAWQQVAGFSRVSSLAHLGGACFGLVWWLAENFREKERAREVVRGG